MRNFRLWLPAPVLAVVVLSILVSCGKGNDALTIGAPCAPGQSTACVAPGGCVGAHACLEDGRSFGECRCEGSGPHGAGTNDTAVAADGPVDTGADGAAPNDTAVAADGPVDTGADGAAPNDTAAAADGPVDTGLPTDAAYAMEAAADRPDRATDTAASSPFVAVEPCLSESAYVQGNVITATSSLKYSPPCLKVPTGALVTFKEDFTIHPLSPSMKRGNTTNNPIAKTTIGSTATFIFNNPGFFAYYCDYHGAGDSGQGMTGVVWVDGESRDAGAVDTAALTIIPSSYDFGRVPIGASSETFTFNVTNSATELYRDCS